MTGSENTRWVALSALGAAMFAIGFSFTAVACNTRDVSVAEAARAAQSASELPPPAASLGAVARVVNGASAVAPSASSASSASTALSAGMSAAPIVGKESSADGALKLKRFVVTHKIEQREPVAGDDFKVDSAPVYAFVELENTGKSARSIRVLFENEDTKTTVGHVKLTVPAAQPHYRTWGNTRLIRDPGHWVAVVSTADGVELGRARFDVKG